MIANSHHFAETFAHSVARGETEALKRDAVYWAARLVSEAVTLGYACLDLNALPPILCYDLPDTARHWINQPARWIDTLSTAKAVCQPDVHHDRLAPLCLDADNRLYLYRYWHAEKQLAMNLAKRLLISLVPVSEPVQYFVDTLFGSGHSDQKNAIITALTHHFSIITGGPGTGKTHTMVAFMMASLLSNPTLRIRLIAPTGKAAARMQESIDHLWPGMLSHVPSAYRHPLNHAKAQIPVPVTVHHLLHKRPYDVRSTPRRHQEPVDLLIVDEASMLDLMLAHDLLSIIPDDAIVVLIGDANQLVSVDAGHIFSECASLANQSGFSSLPTIVATLTENYRFGKDSRIGNLSRLIVSNQQAALLDYCRTAKETDDLHLCALNNDMVDQIIQQYRPLIELIIHTPDQLDDIFKAINGIRVITPTYHGPYGVNRINELMMAYLHQRHCRQACLPSTRRHQGKYYPGQLIMIMQNQAGYLYNGQIGVIIQKTDNSPVAVFQRPDQSGVVEIMPASLPAHETAFAMTVHKTQGSEFEHAIVLLPDYAKRLLSRRLLYTAITRAKQRLTLATDVATLTEAMQNEDYHTSALSDHILSIFTPHSDD